MNKARKLLQLLEDGLFGSPGLIFPESAKYAGILFTHGNEGFFLGQPKDIGPDTREGKYQWLRDLAAHQSISETNLGSTVGDGEIGSMGLVWTYPGGGIENGEVPYDAALRECMEEIGFIPDHDVVAEYLHGNGYITYLASLDSKFDNSKVKLNNESMSYGWYGYGDLPDPLHFGVQPALDAFGINGMET